MLPGEPLGMSSRLTSADATSWPFEYVRLYEVTYVYYGRKKKWLQKQWCFIKGKLCGIEQLWAVINSASLISHSDAISEKFGRIIHLVKKLKKVQLNVCWCLPSEPLVRYQVNFCRWHLGKFLGMPTGELLVMSLVELIVIYSMWTFGDVPQINFWWCPLGVLLEMPLG